MLCYINFIRSPLSHPALWLYPLSVLYCWREEIHKETEKMTSGVFFLKYSRNNSILTHGIWNKFMILNTCMKLIMLYLLSLYPSPPPPRPPAPPASWARWPIALIQRQPAFGKAARNGRPICCFSLAIFVFYVLNKKLLLTFNPEMFQTIWSFCMIIHHSAIMQGHFIV